MIDNDSRYDAPQESNELTDPYQTATFKLASILVLMYIVTSYVGGSIILTGDRAVVLFGLSEASLSEGWYWTPLTSILVHGSIAHLGSNLIYLLIFGFKLEERGYSQQGIVIIYLFTGIFSGLISLLFFLDFNSITLGASGAVFGLLGANVGIEKKNNEESYKRVLFISIFLFIFSSGPNTNVFAHLLGLILGYVLGNSDFIENYNTSKDEFR